MAAARNLDTDAGIHYGSQAKQLSVDAYQKIEDIRLDTSRNGFQQELAIQQVVSDHNREMAAGRNADKYLGDEIRRTTADPRYDTAATTRLLTNSLYQRNADDSLLLDAAGKPQTFAASDYDPSTAGAALSQGHQHLVAPEIFKQFIDKLPEDAVTYSREALPGGRGYKQVAKSNVFELTPEGAYVLDKRTGQRVLKNSAETLVAFQSDPVQKQYLDGVMQDHQQQLAGAAEAMKNYQPLSPEQTEAVRMESSPDGPRLEALKKGLVQYGYGRQETDLLQKPAHVAGAARHPAGLKFTQQGGMAFTPEAIGGPGAQGLLAAASSDPMLRAKADGSRVPYTAKDVHARYLLLRNGQPRQLVTGNAVPQDLHYIKPQLHATTPEGDVVAPNDPTLEQRFQRGDRQPLLDWFRQQREQNPKLRFQWHVLAAPAKEKSTDEAAAQTIFHRLQAERKAAGRGAGDPGYQGDDKLLDAARKMASQPGGSLLVPYTGSSKRDVDAATGYMLRTPTRQKRMQTEQEYFERETAPRPAEQRAISAKKGTGVDFGTAPKPTARPTPTAESFKRAGAKKTGISF